MSNSYPADDVIKIITGCSEVICEMESANYSDVRADCYPTTSEPPTTHTTTAKNISKRIICSI